MPGPGGCESALGAVPNGGEDCPGVDACSGAQSHTPPRAWVSASGRSVRRLLSPIAMCGLDQPSAAALAAVRSTPSVTPFSSYASQIGTTLCRRSASWFTTDGDE